MERIQVQILSNGKSAKEVNTKTNAKMGIRHVNYESMLRTFKIDPNETLKTSVGEKVMAEVLPNGKISFVK
mgnify:CR=1 FL=1